MTEMNEKLPDCPTWKALREVVDLDWESIRNYLRSWPDHLRPAVALALSVAHWSPRARQEYDDAGQLPNYGEFHAGATRCGLCILYGRECDRCPVGNCLLPGSLYSDVVDAEDAHVGFHAAADKLYDKLVELYAAEWEKL